jgi:hypothetical protein
MPARAPRCGMRAPPPAPPACGHSSVRTCTPHTHILFGAQRQHHGSTCARAAPAAVPRCDGAVLMWPAPAPTHQPRALLLQLDDLLCLVLVLLQQRLSYLSGHAHLVVLLLHLHHQLRYHVLLFVVIIPAERQQQCAACVYVSRCTLARGLVGTRGGWQHRGMTAPACPHGGRVVCDASTQQQP